MKDLKPTCRIAVVQAAPVLFDKTACTDKAVRLIAECAQHGAELIVFPELFIPGYPYGMTFGFTVGARNEDGRKDWQLYCGNSIVVPGPETERLAAAAKAAQVDHFVRTLPHGYDTVLNEEGTNVSQGQKQLLTIARTIISNPKIMILDEATSSVDTRTEILIQKAMNKLTEGRTSFIIAHRLSTIRDADIILVMRDGDIVETGNHEELLARGGFYAELYNSQFAGAE